ncbi:RHS repeat-associated core domain-containing protein [Chryseobacterium sp. JV558]|uniref:RHS repeat-associated core domain-containing protein n=1 Tax=Chryseobacterium sp. JV558 TaxID=2663236 RepID=UPI00299EC4AA|nr:RHS repeat-associated core domain-containing protein [Chryseobacterium sp. JV558]
MGNVRVSYGRNSAGVLEITDSNDYYPFGMNHLKTGNAFFGRGSYKDNKYNGKELQETGMYSYGWRDYMPDIGRWNGIDQLAEAYSSTSPYAYVANNPVLMTDPDGRWMDDSGHITDTTGQTFGFHGPSYRPQNVTNYLGVNPGDGGGGDGYNFTGKDAVTMFSYFRDGGTMSGLSFDNNGAIGWIGNPTLTTYSGTDIHGEIDLGTGYSAKFKDLPLDAYKNWADWGASTAGGGFKYLANKRTALYNSGYWIDNLGQMRSTAYAGRARGSLIGLRSDYVKHTAMLGKYAKRAGYVGYAISAGQIGYGVYKDDWKFGVKAQIATANVAGGMAGAAAGAWALGKVGGAIGTLVGPEGTIIGAAVGGIVGGIVGGVWGGDIAEGWASNALNKADY